MTSALPPVLPLAPRPEAASTTATLAAFLDAEGRALALSTERSIARLRPWVVGAALVGALWVAAFVDRPLGLASSVMACLAIAYDVLVVRRLLANDRYLPYLRVANVTLEISVPTLVSLLEAVRMGGHYALTTTTPLISLLAVFGSGLRFSRRLAVYAGLLGATEYLGLFVFARQSLPPQWQAVPTLQAPFALHHAVYCLAAGVLAAVMANIGKAMTRRVAAQLVEKERARELLGIYAAPGITDGPAVRCERREVTVLFADIRGFTTLSFAHPPEVIVDYLDRYFEKACETVAAHQGTVNKFMGDGFLAVFDRVGDDADHATRAARAALALVRELGELPKPDGERTRIGVGLHTGELVVGSVGAGRRRDFTVIGDAVNVAARIEGLTRQFDVDILLTEATRRAARGPLRTEALGPVSVKGRSEPVVIHRLLEDPPGP